MQRIYRMVIRYRRFKEKVHSTWLYKKYDYYRTELDNQKQNRELIGIDREGNKYYQYYSFHGLPTRREIIFKDPNNLSMKDLAFYNWLYKVQDHPPTKEELDKFYIDEAKRKELGRKWDEEQKQMMIDFYMQRSIKLESSKEKMKEHARLLEQTNKSASEIQKEINVELPEESEAKGNDGTFEPEAWQPSLSKVKGRKT